MVARMTIKEASRKRLLLSLLVLTAALVLLTSFGFSRIPTIKNGGQPLGSEEVKFLAAVLLILIIFMFTFVLALSAAFVASPAISGDVESGIALAMLTRPISRLDLVAGKWLGLTAMVTIYVVTACGLEFFLVWLGTGYQPPYPLQFMAYMIGEAVVVLTASLLLSTRLSAMTGGVIALGLYGLAWIGGIASAIGLAFHNDAIANAGTVSKLLIPTDGLWHGAIFSLEPAVMLTAADAASATRGGNPFFSPSGPPLSYDLWVCFWIVGVLALAAWSFQHREV